MTLKRLIQVIFPPPRKRVTCLFLELRDIVLFTSPAAFLLLLVTPWVWWLTLASLSGLTGLRGPVALVTRLCLVGVFVILMAEPRAVRKSEILSVVYALDISDSIGEEPSDEALKYIMRTAQVVCRPEESSRSRRSTSASPRTPPTW